MEHLSNLKRHELRELRVRHNDQLTVIVSECLSRNWSADATRDQTDSRLTGIMPLVKAVGYVYRGA